MGCRSRTLTHRRGYLEEHRLGIKIVALLQHRLQNLLQGMSTRTEGKSLLRCGARRTGTIHCNALITQALHQTTQELVLTVYEQRRQLWVVVIPAPAFAQEVFFLEIRDSHQITMNRVDAQGLDALHKGFHIPRLKHRVHATHTIEVTRKHTVLHFTRIAQRGVITIT